MHIVIAAKPGDLALGVAASGLLNLRHSSLKRRTKQDVFANLRVADKSEGLRRRRNAAAQDVPDFIDPACSKHLLNAAVNAWVQLFALRHQPDFDYCESAQRIAPATQKLTGRSSCEKGYFDGANNLLRIARSDAGCAARITAAQNAVQ